MISDYKIVDTILFSEPIGVFAQRLRAARKDYFDFNERIVIVQDIADTYPYIDSAGIKLIEIQKIINSVDISNCFILFTTANQDIASEIDFITKFYSIDSNPINFLIVEGDYNKEILRYFNTACQKLWNHLYVGPDNNINPCCVANHRFPIGNAKNDTIDSIIHSEKADQFRHWMTQGYRPLACGPCYLNEDNGLPSNRLPCDPLSQKINITSLDVRINNICNFKCRMCSEYFSSAIQQETIQLYGKNAVLGHEQISLDTVLSTEKKDFYQKILPYLTKGLKEINFAGGEPLLAIEHYQMLDQLLGIGNTDIQISYNTNLSTLTYKNFNVIDYWNQFNDVTVGASIDASDRVAEYVRHGTEWTDITENILLIKTFAPKVKLQITSTVGFLTIENLIQLQTKWINQGLFKIDDLKLKVLVAPDYLSPAALPVHHKKRLTAIIQNHINWLGETSLASLWQDVLQFMNNNDYTHSLNDFRHRTCVLDNHRKESFLDIFPEFQDLYV